MRDNRQNVEERRAAKKAARRAYKAIRSGILPEDREKFDDAVKEAVDAVTLMVQDRTDEAMNRYNRKK